MCIIKCLKYNSTKKEFKNKFIDLIFKKAKNKQEAENNKYIQIPNSVTSIGSYAFSFCKSLTLITIPKKIENEMEKVFCSIDLSNVKVTYT